MALSRPFHSSKLIRLLSEATLLDMNAPRQDFAERLALWLSASDTVRLHAALQLQADQPPTASQNVAARQTNAAAVATACHKAHTQLTKAILAHEALGATGHDDPNGGYAPYRKRHLDQQRQMELKIRPLRAQVREALANTSPKLRQLATLDAVLEQTLGVREQKLLTMVAVFLEKRFEQMKRAHLSEHGEAEPQGAPPKWLEAFSQEWQAVVLAELDVRWQPIMGLIEAMSNEIET
jgi:hypothetical protein